MSSATNHNERPLTVRIVVAMVLGVLAGLLFRHSMIPLGLAGKLFIQLIKVLAIPLVFFSIIDAMITTQISWRSAGRLLIVVLINTSIALIIGLTLSNFVQPGLYCQRSAQAAAPVVAPNVESIDFARVFSSIVPTSIVAPFAENNVISIVLLALLLGSALRQHLSGGKAEYELVQAERLVRTAISVCNSVLMLLVRLVPIAVFCVTARTVGEYGFEPFKGLSLYIALAVIGMAIQIVCVYPVWISLVAGIPLRRFLELAKKPVVYAFGTNSSLATLPLTLDALDSLHVSKSSSRLGACVGTNLNNDGIVLYEAMAVLFVAQAFGFHLTVGQQITAALMSLVAAIGVAGVPEAGVVSLSLVLTAVGLPLEIVPLLLTVDWIVARMRSITNVLSDMAVSIGIEGLHHGRVRGA
jgi:DAACS family dicarboxylate/amino acid:cation (Na+ or H+) symporter